MNHFSAPMTGSTESADRASVQSCSMIQYSCSLTSTAISVEPTARPEVHPSSEANGHGVSIGNFHSCDCLCLGLTAGMHPESKSQEAEREDCPGYCRTESQCQSGGGGSARRLEPRQAAQSEYRYQGAIGQPALTGVEADAVIAGRPYDDPDELVTRHILSQSQVRQDCGSADGEEVSHG